MFKHLRKSLFYGIVIMFLLLQWFIIIFLIFWSWAIAGWNQSVRALKKLAWRCLNYCVYSARRSFAILKDFSSWETARLLSRYRLLQIYGCIHCILVDVTLYFSFAVSQANKETELLFIFWIDIRWRCNRYFQSEAKVLLLLDYF